jgi:hypothetical protein
MAITTVGNCASNRNYIIFEVELFAKARTVGQTLKITFSQILPRRFAHSLLTSRGEKQNNNKRIDFIRTAWVNPIGMLNAARSAVHRSLYVRLSTYPALTSA